MFCFFGVFFSFIACGSVLAPVLGLMASICTNFMVFFKYLLFLILCIFNTQPLDLYVNKWGISLTNFLIILSRNTFLMPLLVFILSILFPLSMICYSKSVLIRTFSSKMFLMSFLSTFLVNLVKNMNYMSKWHLFSTLLLSIVHIWVNYVLQSADIILTQKYKSAADSVVLFSTTDYIEVIIVTLFFILFCCHASISK